MGGPSSEATDPQSARHYSVPLIDEMGLSLLVATSRIAAALFAVFAGYNLVDLPRAALLPVLVHDLAMIVLCLGTLRLVRRGVLHARRSHAATAVLIVFAASNTLLALSLVGRAIYSVHIMLILLALGSLVLSTGWFLWGAATILCAWAPIAWLAAPQASFWDLVFSQVLAFGIAFGVQLTRVRHVRRIGRMRHRDRLRSEQLAVALADRERELSERKRAEAERDSAEEQLLQAQKLEAIGTLAGGVAHDMNNTLTVVSGLASLLRESAAPDHPWGGDLDQILKAAGRGRELTRNLLAFARKGRYRRETVDLEETVDDVRLILERTLSRKIRVLSSVSADLAAVEGDPDQLSQVLMNLCVNAAAAMPEGGTLAITAANATVGGSEAVGAPPDLAPGPYVVLRVKDDGVGMGEAIRRRAFDPFFTTKPRGQGTGLGLAMVYGAVESHGGRADIHSVAGSGTTVGIWLPAALAVEPRATEAPASAHPPREAGPPRPGVVLVIDDEAPVRATLRRALQSQGHTVYTAVNGAEGAICYQERRDEIDLVLLDVEMPVLSGPACLERLLAANPEARVLVVSGYAQGREVEGMLARGAVGFLAKPFELQTLRTEVAALLPPRQELRNHAS